MKNLVGCVLLCAVSFLTAPGVVAQKPAAATVTSTEDDRILDQVRMRLAGDADVKGGALEVAV
jgi:hypothetical protein